MIEDVCTAIKNSKKPLIVTHHNADIDSLASALMLLEGLKQFKVNAHVACTQGISKRAKKLSNGYEIQENPDTAKYDAVIIVDTSTKEQLAGIDLKHDNIIVIDHHATNNLKEISKISYVDKNESSVCEMIEKIMNKLNIKKTRVITELLACGILAETAYFRYANPTTFKLFSSLIDSIDYDKVKDTIQTDFDISEKIARLKSAGRARIYKIGDMITVFSEVSSYEASAARSLMGLGADLSIVACCKDNEIRISSRGNKKIGEKIDLAKDVFSHIGDIIGGSGGGHALAASANGNKPQSIFEVNRKILSLLEEKLGISKEIT